jgi:transposase
MDLALIIAQQQESIKAKDAEIKGYEDLIIKYNEFKIEIEQKYAKLLYDYENLAKQLFGKKSERFIPDLSHIPNLFSQLAEENQEKQEEISTEPAKEVVTYERKKSNHKGRKLLETVGHLRYEETIIDLENREDYFEQIGKTVRDLLAIKPNELYVIRQIAKTYKNPNTGEILQATFAEQGIKCEADTSLLAYLSVSKFVDHLPEYRMQQMFKRNEVVIPSSTMNGWTHKVAEVIKLVALSIKKTILSQNYIQIDESSIKVLFEKKGGTHKGFMWVIVDPKTKNTYFEYQPGKGNEIPKIMLEKFSGKLQSDGYQAYEFIDGIKEEIDHYCCFAHGRRKFTDSLTSNKEKAEEILLLIQKLYAVERYCRDNSYDSNQRKEYRSKEALPILALIKEWLEKTSLTLLPKSPMGGAIAYCLKRWNKLEKYAHTGDVEIDNNNVENAIRPLALGRKNYLFAGGHEPARNISYFYTVFSTCKSMGINPYDYLKWYLGPTESK